ncbi:hypothetical protein CC1G_03879 [Coprinopsis cinerea okayama7|uniref:RRM domain-containing protein n=1 Tax=Coprinopsis cinerea (strain Okayama-7 / 130 / ATCC MYA-4618 / FGSC 9003) TaxID=240176 RepID=A8NH25_COPC7|nr:hypothetical protein CC1G_03879 [Coprinopsis cinerea okayama7\|eukprot:XP_001833662.2 hypothetical protein CC1G_03879 [Coprinopsis cinerea okayama7\
MVGFFLFAILYKRFRPTNEALIAFKSPSSLQNYLDIINRLEFYGMKIKAQPEIPGSGSDLTRLSRSRGHRGRKEAAERGVWDGDGPNAGVRGLNIGRAVTIWGFPGKATVSAVEKFMENYAVSRAKVGDTDEAMIYKFPL